jgi:hypothetical protein
MRLLDHWKTVRHFRSAERRRLHRLREAARLRLASRAACGAVAWIEAPERFELHLPEHHEKVTRFLARLRDAHLPYLGKIGIDFRNTELMVAGGTLLFFSELNRLVALYPGAKYVCRPSRDDVVNQVLKHLGIYSMLGFASEVVPQRHDVVRWAKATSSAIEGDKVGKVIDAYGTLLAKKSQYVFRAVGEAMTNVVNHAYVKRRFDRMPRPVEGNWWLFCREDKDRLYVAVCDLGIGIPRSLPIKYSTEAILRTLGELSGGKKFASDAMMIQASMELKRTRTSTAGRGLGLNDMRRLVDEVDGSTMFLFSNRGLVRYKSGKFERQNFKTSILGTLAVWVVPLPENEND